MGGTHRFLLRPVTMVLTTASVADSEKCKKSPILLAVPRGLEPPTFGLGTSRSRFLSEVRVALPLFGARVDVSLTGLDVVGPLNVNQLRTARSIRCKMS